MTDERQLSGRPVTIHPLSVWIVLSVLWVFLLGACLRAALGGAYNAEPGFWRPATGCSGGYWWYCGLRYRSGVHVRETAVIVFPAVLALGGRVCFGGA
jgi:hypothetical protein